MAPRINTITALDIGTSKIGIAIAEHTPDGQLNLIGVGTSSSKGLRKGVVINIEATVESISAALSQAEAMAGCEAHSAFASISGSHIKGFNSHGIVGVKHREVTQDDVDRVIEAAKAVAIPLDREILHVLPQEYIIDEQDGIREPVGMSGVRLEARVHIVTGSVASAQNIVKCANRCGLNVDDIVLSPIASGKAVLTLEEMELGVCLLDIGGGTSDIIVFHGGAVKYTSVISVGGNHVTNDIAAGLRTPVAAAERIKCSSGTALANEVNKEDTIEVPSTGDRQPRVLSKSLLADIIEPRVSEMFSLIQRDLGRSGCEELLTSGIVIAGGCSSMPGMIEVAERIFNLPVRVGRTRDIGGLKDLIDGPEHATAAGLLLYGREQAGRHHRRPGVRFPMSGLLKRAGNWLGEHF